MILNLAPNRGFELRGLKAYQDRQKKTVFEGAKNIFEGAKVGFHLLAGGHHGAKVGFELWKDPEGCKEHLRELQRTSSRLRGCKGGLFIVWQSSRLPEGFICTLVGLFAPKVGTMLQRWASSPGRCSLHPRRCSLQPSGSFQRWAFWLLW